MTPEERQEKIDELETALDTVPDEIRAFLWSDAYQGLLAGMAKACGLTDEQKKVVDDIIFDTVVGIIENEKEVYDRFAAAGISENKQGQLIFYIDQYFITPSADEAEVVADLNKNDSESENVSDSQTTTAPSPLQAIKSIQERLTNPIAVAPAVRDQSITKPQQPTSPVENVSETKQIDPYHEPIE